MYGFEQESSFFCMLRLSYCFNKYPKIVLSFDKKNANMTKK